ncbi:mechanosensitive ion channel [Chamaesiphon sp. VAR_48_metabat_135_sub]|uniref:mechanosensitive ion channel n=1 Tax=Chamaesiphon sp. VAR_48_metabat_135_sub TaxID=2964699 RepID=UPI00286B5D5E|nr:mechanosensitive ion channel [Chamaesiphon sp. VAR_48_metabat_135_sub]
MNETWQLISAVPGTSQLIAKNWLVAQVAVPTSVTTNFSTTGVENFVKQTGGTIGAFLPSLLGAVVTLFVGWIVAFVVSSVVRNLLKRTELDDRLGNLATGNSGSSRSNMNTEKLVGDIVFWLIFLFALLGFLNALNLTVVAQPLNNVLNQILAFVPKLASAAALGAIAWLLATAVKTIVVRTAGTVLPAMSRRLAVGENQVLPSETLGNALYWFVFLFFLPAILGVLELQGPLAPVQNLLNDILSALPNIFKAALIGIVGWFVARIVRELVTNLLAAAGTERLATKIGLNRAAPGQSLSGLLGTIVYLMVLIPTAVAALDALQIPAISRPATSMLQQVLNTIPQILTAAGILAVAYVVSQFIGDLVTNLLSGLGFNNIFQALGLNTLHQTTTTTTPPDSSSVSTSRGTIVPSSTKRTPSQVAGLIAQIGVMIVAAVAATGVLGIPSLTQLVEGLLLISGQVLSGVVVFAIGLYLANLAQKVVSSSGTHQSKVLGQIARLAIIAFVGAMALQQMGIAASIVNLAFGLLLGAIAVATAISFGLGGRDVASEQLRDWMSGFRDKR